MHYHPALHANSAFHRPRLGPLSSINNLNIELSGWGTVGKEVFVLYNYEGAGTIDDDAVQGMRYLYSFSFGA